MSVTGRWFSPGTPVSSTNNTDRHDIAEILLKVALDTINQSINKSKSEQMAIELLFFKHTPKPEHLVQWNLPNPTHQRIRGNVSDCTGRRNTQVLS